MVMAQSFKIGELAFDAVVVIVKSMPVDEKGRQLSSIRRWNTSVSVRPIVVVNVYFLPKGVV